MLKSLASKSLSHANFVCHHVTASEQGQLQGAINGLRSLAGLIGPAMFTVVFAKAITPGFPLQLPGAPFYLAAFMVVLSLTTALVVTRSAGTRH